MKIMSKLIPFSDNWCIMDIWCGYMKAPNRSRYSIKAPRSPSICICKCIAVPIMRFNMVEHAFLNPVCIFKFISFFSSISAYS